MRGRPATVVSFDPVEGGALCREHRRGPAIDPAALVLIRRILGGQLGVGLGRAGRIRTAAVAALATAALEAHLERRLRTVHLLGGSVNSGGQASPPPLA